jgi:carbon-monoxide dehydrogenase large subunit
VLTFADLERWMKPLPLFGAIPAGLSARVQVSMKQVGQLAMCRDTARYVGEIVAMVVAGSRALAEDAAELVEVDYEPLPVVTDMVAAGEAASPVIHAEWGSNVALEFKTGFGDVEGALRAADVRVRERFYVQRYVGMPLETRGVVAQWDARDGSLTTWNGTQVVHFVQQGLVAALGLPAHKIRVIAPDVGGGFGTKATGYPEDLLIPAAAIACRRPVKWTEDRREHMMAAAHARHQVHDIEIGARRDGTMMAVRDRIWVDLGAYNSWGIVLPYNTVAHLLGPHRVPTLDVACRGVVTNKTPNAPYRGAGRPETVFAMDRIVDCLATALRMDPADLRRKNYLSAADLPYELDIPYRDGNRLIYDSGDFRANLESALEAIDYPARRREQAALRKKAVYRGIGISGYVEGTAIGPYEGATVRMDASGRAVVATGACSQGQGHETSFAQVAADALGVPLDWITVVGGDTAAIPFGIGTFASRSAVNAGSSIHVAAGKVRDKLAEAAAALLEAAPADVEIVDGVASVRGAPGSGLPLARVIQGSLPTFTYTSAVHVAHVEVDAGTGAVRLLRYVVAHDCGRLINPLIVEGQIHGGVAQGIGGGLLEEMVYDEQGQLLTGTFMDYLVPTAMELPPIETVHLEYPSPRNPLGVKGIGEGGAISPPAALANAVEDALSPFGVRVTRAPLGPSTVLDLINAARAKGGPVGTRP